MNTQTNPSTAQYAAKIFLIGVGVWNDTIDESTYAELLKESQGEGYDVTRLKEGIAELVRDMKLEVERMNLSTKQYRSIDASDED